MVGFKEVELSDRDWVDHLLRLSDFRGAEYCFTNLFIWKHVYHTRIAQWNHFLLIRVGSAAHPTDIFPAGAGDVPSMMELLLTSALEEKRDFKMGGVSPEQVALLQRLYPGLFEITPAIDSWDYLYKVEDLSSLQGKRYQSKRNHIARFVELPDWSYERISGRNIEECIEMNKVWCTLMGCADNKSLSMETCAVESGLYHFEALGLEGALLRVSNKVVAYTVGEPLNSDTYIVHAEKAFPDVRGAYPTINREFVRDRGASLTYVNREDDAGDEGLRKAKSSYHPSLMVEKYFLVASYNSLSLRR